MSREMQLIVRCDACDKRGEQTLVDPDDDEFQLDLGFGPVTIDLCKKDRKDLLEDLLELVHERGSRVATTKAPAKKADPRVDPFGPACPQCGFRPRGNRSSTLNHMTGLHRIDRVEASKLVPPPKEEIVICPECGFLASKGQGITMHVTTAHGADAWQKVKRQL